MTSQLEPLSGHPDTETLSRHLEGELDRVRDEQLRHHLATCERCSGELQSLERMILVARDVQVEWQEKGAVWSRVEEALEPRAADQVNSRAGRASRSGGPRWLSPAALLLAAGLALVIAGIERGGETDRPTEFPSTLSPGARAAYIAAEREVSQGVEEIREALVVSPYDPRLARLLERTLARRAELAREGAL